MVQAAINGHNQFKRAQALEGKALLQAEQVLAEAATAARV